VETKFCTERNTHKQIEGVKVKTCYLGITLIQMDSSATVNHDHL